MSLVDEAAAAADDHPPLDDDGLPRRTGTTQHTHLYIFNLYILQINTVL